MLFNAKTIETKRAKGNETFRRSAVKLINVAVKIVAVYGGTTKIASNLVHRDYSRPLHPNSYLISYVFLRTDLNAFPVLFGWNVND